MDYYHQLRLAASKSRRKFLYDTNVGAGLPVIENLQNLLNAGMNCSVSPAFFPARCRLSSASWMRA